MIHKLPYLIRFCVLAALVATIFSCSGKAPKDKTERIITVTIEPQRYFAEAIAGDKFTVKSMVPKGVSPETYDPTPQQLVSLNESEAYFRIGYIGFELTWMNRLKENASHLKIFDLSEGVELIRDSGHFHGDHYHEGGVEPHIWNSAVNAKIIAGNMLKAFISLDPDNHSYYRERYFALIAKIEETDNTIFGILQNENASRAFMIYHPALSYYARDYGLHQISIEEGGKEPSPSHMKELIEVSNFENVNVIFIQPEFDRRNAEVIAKEIGAEIVPINPLSYDWNEEMIRVAESLVRK